nr:MAG TPA: hypothetical protein [Crassvirales sp.]
MKDFTDFTRFYKGLTLRSTLPVTEGKHLKFT